MIQLGLIFVKYDKKAFINSRIVAERRVKNYNHSKKKYFKWCFFINLTLLYLILNLVIPLSISNTGKTSIYTWCNGEAVTISRGREMIHRPLYPRWLTTKYCYYCMWAEYQHVSMATCYFFSSLSESLSASRYGVHFKWSKQFAFCFG